MAPHLQARRLESAETVKFLHAADIHLDSPMQGLRDRSDLPDGLLRNCTRRAFSAMVDLARAEDVAFVVIAGDLYDGDWRDFSCGLFFAEEMRRLDRPCILLRGNHDARSVITSKLTLPQNVREFAADRAETFALADLNVSLHGRSFQNRAVPENFVPAYPDPVPGHLNVGVLHTSADGASEHDTYAPCSVAELELKGYGYWALGHIHARRELSPRVPVVFPGNLQGRHVGETGAKGCSLVTVEDRRVVAAEHRSVDVLRWAALRIEVSRSGHLSDAIVEAAAALVAEAEGRPVLARVTLTGVTDQHDWLVNDRDAVAAEIRNAAGEAGGQVWIESVRVKTRPAHAAADSADVAAPLQAAFMAELDDDAVATALLADFAALRQKLPQQARDLDLPGDVEDLRALGLEAWAMVADALARTP